MAQALLKAGANANTPGLHNVTALHDATAWSHISVSVENIFGTQRPQQSKYFSYRQVYKAVLKV